MYQARVQPSDARSRNLGVTTQPSPTYHAKHRSGASSEDGRKAERSQLKRGQNLGGTWQGV